MYPMLRLALTLRAARRLPALTVGEVHVSRHLVLPWDIDVFGELNNGRTLTLFDLGRVGMFQRLGVMEAMRKQGWAGAVAGASVRYRRRVRMWDRVTLRTVIVGWDDRFMYCDQTMWRGDVCTGQGLMRLVVSGPGGIVPTKEITAAMGHAPESPPLPDWIAAWIDAEAQRPWPPIDPVAKTH